MATDSNYLFEVADDVFERLGKYGYRDLAEFDKVFVSVWSLKGEVDNGGFEQWLFNSSGDWAYDTPRTLEEIGATKIAEIVQEVIQLFPGGCVPEDLDDRRRSMKNIDDKIVQKWDELSDLFYQEENIDELLASYVHSKT